MPFQWKEMDELEKKNEALEEPMDLPKTDEQEKSIRNGADTHLQGAPVIDQRCHIFTDFYGLL